MAKRQSGHQSPSVDGRRANADVQLVEPVRVGAKALIAEGNRVLLVREQRDDGSTFWTLPGGGIRPNESIVEGLRRELAEELRCRSMVGDPVATCAYDHTTSPCTTVYNVYACRLEGSPRPNYAEGIIDHRWATSEGLPGTTLDPFRGLVRNHGLLQGNPGTPFEGD